MANDAPPIGRKLRQPRHMEGAHLNQKQVAKALGVARRAVNACINDRAYPMNSIGPLEDLLPTFHAGWPRRSRSQLRHPRPKNPNEAVNKAIETIRKAFRNERDQEKKMMVMKKTAIARAARV